MQDCRCEVLTHNENIMKCLFIVLCFKKEFITNADIVSYVLPFACHIRQWPLKGINILFNVQHSVFNKDIC